MKALSMLALLAIVLSCGVAATIAPAKYKVEVDGIGTYTDVVHYSWSDTELILTRTEGQVEVIETSPDKVTIDRL